MCIYAAFIHRLSITLNISLHQTSNYSWISVVCHWKYLCLTKKKKNICTKNNIQSSKSSHSNNDCTVYTVLSVSECFAWIRNLIHQQTNSQHTIVFFQDFFLFVFVFLVLHNWNSLCMQEKTVFRLRKKCTWTGGKNIELI